MTRYLYMKMLKFDYDQCIVITISAQLNHIIVQALGNRLGNM